MALTQKEFMGHIVNAIGLSVIVPVEGAPEGATVDMTAEVIKYAQETITKIDARNEARKAKPTKAQTENIALIQAIVSGMTAGFPYTAKALADIHGVSTQKISALMTKAVADGSVTVMDFKPTGKGRSVKGYTLADSDTAEISEGEGDTVEVAEDEGVE